MPKEEKSIKLPRLQCTRIALCHEGFEISAECFRSGRFPGNPVSSGDDVKSRQEKAQCLGFFQTLYPEGPRVPPLRN